MIALAVVSATRWFGVPLPEPATMVAVLVAGMPVAVSCGILTEKYQQDSALAAEAVLVTTLASVVTVPLVAWGFQRVTE